MGKQHRSGASIRKIRIGSAHNFCISHRCTRKVLSFLDKILNPKSLNPSSPQLSQTLNPKTLNPKP